MYVLTFILLGLCTLTVVSPLKCYHCITVDYATIDEFDRRTLLSDELRQCTNSTTCVTGEVCATIPLLMQGTYYKQDTAGRQDLGVRMRTCVKEGFSGKSMESLDSEIGDEHDFKSMQETFGEKLELTGLAFDDEVVYTMGNVEKCSTDLCNKLAAADSTSLDCYSCTTVGTLTTDGFSGAVEASIESLRKEIAVSCTNTTTCVSGAVCGKIPLSLKGTYDDNAGTAGSFQLGVIAKKCVWEAQASYSAEDIDDNSDAFYGAVNIDKNGLYDKIEANGWSLGDFEITCSPGSLETCNNAKCVNSAIGSGKDILYLFVAATVLYLYL